MVPSYVPESELASISDLLRPEVKARLPARIVSLPEATGLTQGGRRVMEAYGLTEAGYELVAAPPSEWLSTFRDAVAERRWIVFPLWQPQWVNAAYDIRKLAEPRNVYGEPDTAYLLGHQQVRDKLSADTLGLLGRMRLSVEAVTEMDRLVNVEGMTPREAARAWLAANPEVRDGWSADNR